MQRRMQFGIRAQAKILVGMILNKLGLGNCRNAALRLAMGEYVKPLIIPMGKEDCIAPLFSSP